MLIEGFPERCDPEDPYGKGVEAVGAIGVEGDSQDNDYWLAAIINKNTFDKIKNSPEGEQFSDESILYNLLLNYLHEAGPELSPDIRRRLQELVTYLDNVLFGEMQVSSDARGDEISDDVRWLKDTLNVDLFWL